MSSQKHYFIRSPSNREHELRKKISETLLSTQINIDEVERRVSSFERRLEEILSRLDELEHRLKKLEELLE